MVTASKPTTEAVPTATSTLVPPPQGGIYIIAPSLITQTNIEVTHPNTSVFSPQQIGSPNVDITKVLLPHEVMLKEIETYNRSLQDQAKKYLSSTFPGLEAFSEPYTEIFQLLVYTYQKSAPWPQVHNFLVTETVERVSNQECVTARPLN